MPVLRKTVKYLKVLFLPLKNKQVKLRGCGLELIAMFVTIIKNAMRYFVAGIYKLCDI